MQNTRIPSVPLIVHDPYFSVWSPADHLNDTTTTSWTGKPMPITAVLTVDGVDYSIAGYDPDLAKLPQVGLTIHPTRTVYTFANAQVQLTVTFAQHFDLTDLQALSEPITYLQTAIKVLDGQEHILRLRWRFDAHLTYENLNDNRLVTKQLIAGPAQMAFVGKAKQSPLNSSGDLIDIDWGYLYLAAANTSVAQVRAYQDWNKRGLEAVLDLTAAPKQTLLVAYDDLQAINYFGTAQNAYWKLEEPSLPALLGKRLPQAEGIFADCARIDQEIADQAQTIGGEDYELICATAYRQAIAAHKLIRDEQGKVIFLSKEDNSNGCIGTVDVSYPSIPLFLAFNPELVQGMLRPIYRFAKLPVWQYDFAPHDVGRYPYATGQVYGLNRDGELDDGSMNQQGDTVAMYYQYPASADCYNFEYQMPVEECGDMIIMAATVDLLQHDGNLIANHDQLLQWSQFLIENGQDPANQLCTDDFAGHLAHNVNLSLKAIVALGALGKALSAYPEYAEEGQQLTAKAHAMADIWINTAASATDTRLAFDQADTWALKYNLVWDSVLDLQLFPETIAQQEIARYCQEANKYGTPLDSRATYTKADWLLWVASLASDADQFSNLIKPVVSFLNESPSRVPFSDWYDTQSGKWVSFRNRTVIAGVFMPMLKALHRF